jgi:hypothetical protein
MEEREEKARRTRETRPPLFEGVVPARAVLTELARGFLLTHDTSRQRATQFAITFLQECTGEPTPLRAAPLQGAASLRRGLSRTLPEAPSSTRERVKRGQ